MRVLVTGSTGYLGRSVVPLLRQRGCSIVALTHSVWPAPHADGIEYHRVDLTQPGGLARLFRNVSFPDAVVHLAGAAPKVDGGWNPEGGRLVSVHVRLALALREALPTWSGRVVHASGMPVYGIPDQLPVRETDPREPCHMYGLAKLLSEDVILSWSGVGRWVLRLPGLFSAERRSGGLYQFMRAAAAGEALRITAGQPTPWDVLHVDDAAEAIWRALTSRHEDPGPVNISYGERVDLESIAHWIAELAGRGSLVENTTKLVHPAFQMDIARAKHLLSWPPVSLRERLRSLYQQFGFGD